MRFHGQQPKPETQWEAVVDIFNCKNAGKIFTRNEIQMYIDYTASHVSHERLTEYRCVLMRAGFLSQVEPGVYRKVKKIPKSLTSTRARQLAYKKRGY